MKTTKRIVLLATILAGIREIHSASAQVQQAWVAHSRDAGAYAIKVDSAGNVYRNGFKTAKYDANGNELWAIRFPGNAGAALALDGVGHVYVTGDAQLDTNIDYVTVKYDADGNELWLARYDGPTGDRDYANAIAVDSAGNVYVTGWSGLPDYSDYATVKYDVNLNQVWVARYD